jgi:hypothetical protein
MSIADDVYTAEMEGVSPGDSAKRSAGSPPARITVYPTPEPVSRNWPEAIVSIIHRVGDLTQDPVLAALRDAELISLADVESNMDPNAAVSETRNRFSYGLFMMLDATARNMYARKARLGANAAALGELPSSNLPSYMLPVLAGEGGIWYAALLMLNFSEWLQSVTTNASSGGPFIARSGSGSVVSALNDAASRAHIRPIAAALRLYWRASSSRGVESQLADGSAAGYLNRYGAKIAQRQQVEAAP